MPPYSDLEKYLTMSGQTEQDVMSGADQYGGDFIFNELVPEAIKEKKRIIWYDDPDTPEGDLPRLLYRFQSL